jgi:Ca-activated chloride channel family protein
MDLAQKYGLIFLVMVPCFLFFAIRAFKDSDRWRYRFARIHKPRRPYTRAVLYISFSLIALILALSKPGIRYEQTRFSRSYIDLIIGIDISKSMLAEGVHFPQEDKKAFKTWNRLNRARVLALALLSRLEGERTGLFIFGRQGIEAIPLTRDYGYCRYVLKHIGAEDITEPGSDLEQAIRTGLGMFTGTGQSKAIILFSDGEDLNPDRFYLRKEAKQAATQKVRIYTVAVGTSEYSLIPMRHAPGGPISDYYRDEKGVVLKTRTQPDTLKTIARITGGTYHTATETGLTQKLINAIVSHAGDAAETRKKVPARFDLTPVFLLAGLLFFTTGILSAD